MNRHIYAIVDELGDKFSADARDYWYLADSDSMAGALVRMDHPYLTVTGLVVYGPRVVREFATARDIRRIAPTLAQLRARHGITA